MSQTSCAPTTNETGIVVSRRESDSDLCSIDERVRFPRDEHQLVGEVDAEFVTRQRGRAGGNRWGCVGGEGVIWSGVPGRFWCSPGGEPVACDSPCFFPPPFLNESNVFSMGRT